MPVAATSRLGAPGLASPAGGPDDLPLAAGAGASTLVGDSGLRSLAGAPGDAPRAGGPGSSTPAGGLGTPPLAGAPGFPPLAGGPGFPPLAGGLDAIVLVLGFLLLRRSRAGTLLGVARLQAAASAVALLPVVATAGAGARRAGLLACALAIGTEAAILLRVLGAPDLAAAERARPRAGLAPLGEGAILAAGLFGTGLLFALVRSSGSALVDAATREGVALGLAIVFTALLATLRQDGAPVRLARLLSLGNALVLLAAAVPWVDAAAPLAALLPGLAALGASPLARRLALGSAGPAP